jgi:hypothetical protein
MTQLQLNTTRRSITGVSSRLDPHAGHGRAFLSCAHCYGFFQLALNLLALYADCILGTMSVTKAIFASNRERELLNSLKPEKAVEFLDEIYAKEHGKYYLVVDRESLDYALTRKEEQ